MTFKNARDTSKYAFKAKGQMGVSVMHVVSIQIQ